MNTPARREVDLEAFTPHQPELETLDLVRYWRAINRNKWGILALVVAVGLLASIYASSLRPIYRGTATLMIEGSRPKAVSNEDIYQYWYWGTTRDYYLTQDEIIKSRDFAERLVGVLGLTRHPDYDPRQQPGPWYAKWLPGFLRHKPGPAMSESDVRDAVVANVMGNTSVQPVRNTQIVKLSFNSYDPKIAERVPNTLAMIYIVADLEARAQMSRRATLFLDKQAESLKKKLADSEAALQAYRDREKIVEAKGAPMAGAGRQLEALTLSLVDARQKAADAEAAYQQVMTAKQSGSLEALDTLPAILKNPAVQRLKDVEGEARRKLSDASKRYGPEHPKYVSATAEYKSAQDNLRKQVDATVKTISKEYDLTRANEAAIERAITRSKAEIQSQNRKDFELQSLEREVSTNRQLYDQFMQRAKQTRAGDMESAVARVIDPAELPKGPSGPNKRLIVGLAVLAALLSGLSLAILVERLDNRLKSTHEMESRLDIRSVGVLPRTGKPQGVAIERSYHESTQSAFSEAVRTVRSALLLSGIETRKQVILVTSSIPDEGKSTLAGNLALSMAQVKNTLLLEADMRRPKFARTFGVDGARPGLADLVAGSATLKDGVYRLEDSGLNVLQAGRVPQNPLTLLSSPAFAETIRELIDAFDVIVIDSPPVQLVSDAVVLSQIATSVLFVVKASSTPYPVARHALGRLRRADAPVLGAVLNQIDIEMADKYYGEHSGFGSKYYRKYGYHYSE